MKPNDARIAPQIAELGEAHRDEIATHLLRLAADDRYLRFGVRGAGDATVRAHADAIDFARDVVLGVREASGTLVAIGEVLRCGRAAEVAVSVDGAWRGCGFAGALLAASIEAAQRAGATALLGQFVAENRTVRRLLERAGFAIEREDGEYVASVTLGEPLPAAA
jgi:GNAT superfamily N-acetyltransferase